MSGPLSDCGSSEGGTRTRCNPVYRPYVFRYVTTVRVGKPYVLVTDDVAVLHAFEHTWYACPSRLVIRALRRNVPDIQYK